MIDDIDKLKPAGSEEQSEKQNSIENTSDGRSFQNIPAILPYEAKQALLKEIRHRVNRNLLKPVKESRSSLEASKDVKAYEVNLNPEENDVNQDSEEDFENIVKERKEYVEGTKENVLKLDSSKFKTKSQLTTKKKGKIKG